jgi:hypothetical protein
MRFDSSFSVVRALRQQLQRRHALRHSFSDLRAFQQQLQRHALQQQFGATCASAAASATCVRFE